VRVRGFRAARDVGFAPGAVCALVGEANAGKSTLLAAVRALLDSAAAPLRAGDLTRGDGGGGLLIEAELGSGETVRLAGLPPASERVFPAGLPGVIAMPAELRAGEVVDSGGRAGRRARPALALLDRALAHQRDMHPFGTSTTTGARTLVGALESLCATDATGLLVLIEEPELYLRPQAQRYLSRLLRSLAAAGNQVVFSTSAPAFLNVGRLEELVFVTHDPDAGVRAHQPAPLAVEPDFRLLTEFDAERSELFLARAALLVEGATEKLVFPLVFRALGHDPDREGVTIVECGGKSNIPFFASVCEAAGIPFVAVHDRDARPGRRPIASELAVNRMIAATIGSDRTVELAPDFEHVAGLHGHRHKPERAWERFSAPDARIPEPLAQAVALVLATR